ncbi:flagellar hook-length control protein FliK [Bacillus sp. DTU_2020_1000418_1_SI_GHA_SEK_038]|uniref:flagellar hook-length control protein FliK n=1 Tax=Bacillus sp. DTU_2020_1000418_1_SI_GHA_SEK_038 TaxID=3077585 RepID=UPI0028ED66B1|nr:flagellar hook-length control protein FliK [Bacillus sp. DTU_2020_1000418_1_SI_GHA_SEK_038]WNS77177.1 flagellar hook-length control protein FliK [Bacillus sp. DTU_2020_1000418_1_SI_GHA_SEK_038]
MEMTGLGAIHTIVSNNGNSASPGKVPSGFGALVAGLMGNSPTPVQTDISTNNLPSDELGHLLQFLQITDVFELENGAELLGETSIGNAEIIKIIEDQLNLSSDELLELLSKFYSDISPSAKIEKSRDEDESQIDMILALIGSIISIQKQEMKIEPNRDFGQAMKAIKLFELLSAHQDSLGNQFKLKEFMKNISEKLEMALNNTNSSERGEFAKKTFQALVNELNGKAVAVTDKAGEHIAKALNKSEPVNHQGFIQFQQLSKPEQLTMLSSTGRPVSAEQLIEQFESILSKSQLLKSGGTQRLFLKLNPEHLGSLRIELIQKDSNIIARILTSTGNAKDLMESHLNGLRQAFQSQNIQVERIEISQAFTSQERSYNREGQHQGQERQQQDERQEKQSGDFNHSFEEALLNTEA